MASSNWSDAECIQVSELKLPDRPSEGEGSGGREGGREGGRVKAEGETEGCRVIYVTFVLQASHPQCCT